MTDDQQIQDDGQGTKYFATIPHMADDDLDVYEYRLYGHYKRVCGEKGVCFESTRTTARNTSMTHPTVIKTRRALEDKGFITTTFTKGAPVHIKMVDIWPQNMARYSKPANTDEVVASFTPPGSVVYTKNNVVVGENGRPNCFTIWEQEMGSLTPHILDTLKMYLDDDKCPDEWIGNAIKEASKQNVRRLSYVTAILDDWKVNGPKAKREPEKTVDPLYERMKEAGLVE